MATDCLSQIKVRWMIRGDAYAVSRISKECLHVGLTSREVAVALKQKRTIGTVAECGDLIIGYLLMDMTTSDYCEVMSIGVDPIYQRIGVGTLVIAHAEKIARNLGFTRLVIHVCERLLPYHCWLRSNGYACNEVVRKMFGDDDGYKFVREIV